MSDDLNQVMRIRREKLDLLQAKGILPYAYRFDRTHFAQDAANTFQEAEASGEMEHGDHGPSVRVGGRLKSFRGHGKSAFGHIEDGSGSIQVYFRKDVLGDESFQDVLELVDLGDWLGVEGPLFRTRTGEVTVRARVDPTHRSGQARGNRHPCLRCWGRYRLRRYACGPGWWPWAARSCHQPSR